MTRRLRIIRPAVLDIGRHPLFLPREFGAKPSSGYKARPPHSRCLHWKNIQNIEPNACGETNIPPDQLTQYISTTMGDKSPKSVQKKAGQKQTKTNAVIDKKKSLITAQQATKAKAAANKKK